MYGQMNEPPGARARVALTGLTVAEYFRDVEGQDVLLFIDNIFRFTQAGSEVRAPILQIVGGRDEGCENFQKDKQFIANTPIHCSCTLTGICPAGTYPIRCGLPAHSGH